VWDLKAAEMGATREACRCSGGARRTVRACAHSVAARGPRTCDRGAAACGSVREAGCSTEAGGVNGGGWPLARRGASKDGTAVVGVRPRVKERGGESGRACLGSGAGGVGEATGRRWRDAAARAGPAVAGALSRRGWRDARACARKTTGEARRGLGCCWAGKERRAARGRERPRARGPGQKGEAGRG
jgi:hypothetical protein